MISIPDPEKMRELFIADFEELGMTHAEAEKAYEFGSALGTHLRLDREVTEHAEEGVCTLCDDHPLRVFHREVDNDAFRKTQDLLVKLLEDTWQRGWRYAQAHPSLIPPPAFDYKRPVRVLADDFYNALVCGREGM